MWVSINGGTPKWMVYKGKSYKIGWLRGTPWYRKPPYHPWEHGLGFFIWINNACEGRFQPESPIIFMAKYSWFPGSIFRNQSNENTENSCSSGPWLIRANVDIHIHSSSGPNRDSRIPKLKILNQTVWFVGTFHDIPHNSRNIDRDVANSVIW